MNDFDLEALMSSTLSGPSGNPSGSHPPSDLQLAIYGAIREPSTSVLIDAKAGSGKTTTLIGCVDHAPGQSLFLAFNRDIVTEMKARLPFSAKVMTLNGLGHGLWMRYSPQSKLTDQKSYLWFDYLFGKEHPILKEYRYEMKRLIGLAKNAAQGISEDPPVADDFIEMIDSQQMDIPSTLHAQVGGMLSQAYEKIIQDRERFDYDDQLFGPVYWGWSFPHYDNILVDEFQDLTEIQHLMLVQFWKSRSRIIGVGDRHQAIYGFRGAVHDSMDRAKRLFSMLELPLSISYRCSQAVIRDAQAFCPDILPRPGAPEGSTRWLDWDEKDPQTFPSDTLIVCRNNAPLFSSVLRMVRAQLPVRCLSNQLEAFQAFIRKFDVISSRELLGKVTEWFQKESEAAQKKGFLGKLAGLQDRYETIKLFCNQYSTTNEILETFRKLSNGTSGPRFATIHKAKGLEEENVYILRPDLMPAFYAKSSEQLQQEANMQYVAITRAKMNLTYGEQKR